MAYAATAEISFAPTPVAAPGVLALQRAMVWLVGASGAIVFIEPSPYELVTLLAAILFFATGARLRLAFMPLLFLIVSLNIGYSIGAIPLYSDSDVFSWIMTSWYMAVTVIFFAVVISEDTAARLDMLRRGLVVGAMIASLSAIGGYFNLVPGGHDLLTLYERARGTFKDPNVLGAFLILPALFVLQDVVTARFGKALRNAIAFGIMSLAILLAFSRAAWGLHAGADGPDQPVAAGAIAHRHPHDRRRRYRRAAARRAAVVQFRRRDVQAARELRPEL
jgi:hypothetical protein